MCVSTWNLDDMRALMYVMCIYIDVSCINMVYETCAMMVNNLKMFCSKTPNQTQIILVI
jgi:hypothetical protein